VNEADIVGFTDDDIEFQVHNIEEMVRNVERHRHDDQYSSGELAKYKKMIEDSKKSFYHGCVARYMRRVRVLYLGYRGLSVTAKNFGYNRFPLTTNGWETIHPIPDMAPPLQVEEEGPPTQKELIPRVIHAFTIPPYDRREQARFHHLSTRPASLLELRQGPGLCSNMSEGFQQWISIACPGASRSGGLRRLA
jgi:hypothetical protein